MRLLTRLEKTIGITCRGRRSSQRDTNKGSSTFFEFSSWVVAFASSIPRWKKRSGESGVTCINAIPMKLFSFGSTKIIRYGKSLGQLCCRPFHLRVAFQNPTQDWIKNTCAPPFAGCSDGFDHWGLLNFRGPGTFAGGQLRKYGALRGKNLVYKHNVSKTSPFQSLRAKALLANFRSCAWTSFSGEFSGNHYWWWPF